MVNSHLLTGSHRLQSLNVKEVKNEVMKIEKYLNHPQY